MYPTTTEHQKVYPYTSIIASPYNCDPTGITDCAAAIEIIKANQSNIGMLYIPHGIYSIATDLTIPATMSLFFEKGAMFSVTAGITLTISGYILAGPFQIFSGTGTVSINAVNILQFGAWSGSTGFSIGGATTFSGTVTLSTLTTAGYVKNSVTGLLSTGSIAAGDLPTTTESVQGAVELATTTEATTGTDTTRAVTPAGVKACTNALSIPATASKSDQEAGTEAAKYVAPATQQFHPSAAKAWAKWTGNSTTILASENVSSITDGSVKSTINFIVPFSSSNYVGIPAGHDAGSVFVGGIMGQDAGSITIGFVRPMGPASEDPTSAHIACFGDQ